VFWLCISSYDLSFVFRLLAAWTRRGVFHPFKRPVIPQADKRLNVMPDA
jgi:hypothetical protein